MFGLSIGLSCIRMCRWLWGFGTIKVLGEHLHRLHTTTKSGGDPTIITFQLLLSIFPSACVASATSTPAKVHNDTFVTCSNHISHFIVRAHSPFSQPKGHIKILQLARTLLLIWWGQLTFPLHTLNSFDSSSSSVKTREFVDHILKTVKQNYIFLKDGFPKISPRLLVEWAFSRGLKVSTLM